LRKAKWKAKPLPHFKIFAKFLEAMTEKKTLSGNGSFRIEKSIKIV